MEQFFYENRTINVAIVGNIAFDETLLACAKRECKSLFLPTTCDELIDLGKTQKIDLLFGEIALTDECMLKTLEAFRLEDPKTNIVLFFPYMCEIPFEERLDKLRCKRYFCMNSQRKHVQKLFLESLEELSNERLMHKEAQYFDALAKSSVVSKSDLEGNITYVNDNFIQVTGYSKEEAIGKNHRILRHPNNPVSVYEQMWGTIQKGEVWRERVLNRNKDGSDFWADTIIIPLRDEKTGAICEYIAVRRDITQMLEEKRAVMAKEIESKERMKLSDAKDSFLILFTHELKTPLNAIINFSEYLHKNMYRIEEIPKAKRIHLLEQIHKSAVGMLKNVTNILELSKLRNGKMSFTHTLFGVKEAILEVLAQHEALAVELKRDISFDDDGSEPLISSDAFRFKQILANLLSNALKYGTSRVRIALSSSKIGVKIEVEDDGKGIDEAHKESIFELYEQSAKGLSSMEKKGTGIGLNFVKLLCDELGFTCNVERSERLGGARFVLEKRF